MNYDLSNSGTTTAFTARVSRRLGTHFVFEGGVLYAKPEQASGSAAFIAPEVQLQYHFGAGRFRPYLGGGLGVARTPYNVLSESGDRLETEWRTTASFGGGARLHLSDRAGLFGELRVRGLGTEVGGTLDIIGGVVLRLGQ